MTQKTKKIIFKEEARLKLLKGLEKAKDSISPTLGPRGKNAILTFINHPKITNDGASILSDIELKDQFENIGVSLAKELANKIKEKSGDGTTTAILLLYSIVKEGIKNISAGAAPIEIKRGLEKTLKKILKNIDNNSKKIKEDEIENIATICASGDKKIGKMIKEAFKKTGKNGVITIEEATSRDTTIELLDGMEFDRGYLSPYFCTNLENLTVELNNPYILITDKKIQSIHDILALIQEISKTKESF